jgi:hypothetical protein
VPLYKVRYGGRAFLPDNYRKRISTLVSKLCRKHGIGVRNHESGLRMSGEDLSKQLNLFPP